MGWATWSQCQEKLDVEVKYHWFSFRNNFIFQLKTLELRGQEIRSVYMVNWKQDTELDLKKSIPMFLHGYYYLRNGVIADFISPWNGSAVMIYNLFHYFVSLGQPNFQMSKGKKDKILSIVEQR